MYRMLLSFVVVTGCLAGWVVPHSVSSLAEEDQGKIVFTSDRDGDDEIYLMNADGSDITRLTDQPGFDAMPDFSPDGKQIVFISRRAGNQEVFVMDADGSNPRQLTETPAREYHPTFSPDGAQIAFMSERDGNVELYRMYPDGSHILRLTDDPGFDGQPAFSPDGEQIAFVSGRDGSWQIYVMNAEGGAVQRLTHDEATNSYPRFSPDGTQIAYESMSGKDISATELYVINADGSHAQRLTENDFFDSMPVWSPDGSQFAFVSDRDGDWRLYMMAVDGTGVRPLTTGNAHHHDWWHPAAPSVDMPTDAVIAFDSDQDGDREIYLMNGDGSNVQQITDNEAHDGLPDWSPDGSRLVFFSDRDGDDEIFVMNADGSDPVQLTFNDTQDRAAVWSPDGSRITFVSMRDGNQEIYLMNSDGSDQRRLTDNDRDDFCPDWSPDGEQITFTAVWSSARQDLYVIDVPDDPQVLPEPRLINESAARADWSPDGSKLAFSSNRNGDWEIFVMNSTGSAPQQVTDNRWDDWVPTWSPDGQWLAWAGESRRAEIYLLHLESSTIYQITSNSAQEWRPIWRPVVNEAPAAPPTVLLVFGQQFIPGIYEAEVPILEEAGYRVVVASSTLNTLRAKESDLRIAPDLRLQDVRVENYAAILFNCDNDLTLGTTMPETNRIVQDAVAQGIVLGAICSGPRVLAYAGVVDGLITTGEPSRACQMLEEQGATCTGAAVEQDGLIVTARDRYTARQFTTTILELLRQNQTAAIVFYSDRDSNAELYVMQADGSHQRRVTVNDADDTSPAWSPDGSQIVFLSDRNDPHPSTCFPHCNEDIYVIDVDGANERQLTSDPAPEYHPDWSPDGQYILFDADRDGDELSEIWRMRADGTEQQVLVNSGFNDYWADWSPDGARLTFISDRDGKQEIYTVAADGSDPQRLTDNDLDEYFPAWSPEGTRIVFMSLSQRQMRLYVLEQTDGDGWQTRDLSVDGEDPVWSPDGQQIVYQHNADGDFEILTVDADGSHPQPLTQNHAGDFWPDWCPCGVIP